MNIAYFQFEADNGQVYCIAGISPEAILAATNGGKEPGSLIKGAGRVGKFTNFRETDASQVRANLAKGYLHYLDMAESNISRGLCQTFWVGKINHRP